MIMQKLDDSVMFNFMRPIVGWHVDHRAEKLEQQVGMFLRDLRELDVLFHVSFECLEWIRIELRNIAANFEQKRVAILESPINQLFMLVVLGHNLSITRIRGKIHCKSDKFFADYRLRAVYYKLEHDRDALCIGESRFEFVFLRHMIQEFED